jgi:hypothetical protein
MGVVVDNEKPQAVEIDTGHKASQGGCRSIRPRGIEAKVLPLRPG